mgnify:CR=1 FL=1
MVPVGPELPPALPRPNVCSQLLLNARARFKVQKAAVLQLGLLAVDRSLVRNLALYETRGGLQWQARELLDQQSGGWRYGSGSLRLGETGFQRHAPSLEGSGEAGRTARRNVSRCLAEITLSDTKSSAATNKRQFRTHECRENSLFDGEF